MRNRLHTALFNIHGTAAMTLLLLPYEVSAQTLTQAVGLFNIFVGLMLVAALLTYGVGFVIWVTRLGTWPSYRTEGIKVMEWSVVILFVLVVLLMVVQFFRDHPAAATYAVAAILLALFAWAILAIVKQSAKKEEGEH